MVVIFYILHYVAGGEKILLLRLYKMVKPNSNLSCKLNIFISLMFLNTARSLRKENKIVFGANFQFSSRGLCRVGPGHVTEDYLDDCVCCLLREMSPVQ